MSSLLGGPLVPLFERKEVTFAARPSFLPRLLRRPMGRHDGVPDLFLDARTRRGGAGVWEIHGGADAASPPGHPADRCPHHAGIGVLAVPARLRWGARRADADPDGSGSRVRRADGPTRLPAAE